ncbi:MAG: winged helix-turn-helix domain-containing protein, partial [Clostridiales bacterium]|nr:winged helix-turn-helix domain-containing protein [Clostridiales bacterium]
IYTPAEKRKFGYYVLPVLCGQEFTGRIEAAADRKTNTLIVKNIWFEPGIRKTKKLKGMTGKAVQRLARFNDCTAIEDRSGELS